MFQSTLFGINLGELNELTVIVRLLLSMCCGGVIGFERARKGRPAGMRTYILVSLGATMAMMTGQFIMLTTGTSDPSRLGAQVISGIGFLGAGTIMTTGYHKIKGLTTAAGLWASACMGLAVGIGFYFAAISCCTIIIVVMINLEKLQARSLKNSRRMQVFVLFQNGMAIKEFMLFTKRNEMSINDFEVSGSPFQDGVSAFFMLKYHEKKTHDEILKMLCECPGVLMIDEI